MIARVLLLVAMLAASVAQAATYFVSTTGNDTNAGTEGAPFRTIAKGASKAAAGDTVYVRGGTYVEAVTMWQSGTAAAPIKLYAYPGEAPVIDGQNTYPIGNYYALIFIGGSYWDVSGFELKNSRQYGVDMPGYHNALRKMNIHDSRYHGVVARGDYSLVEDSRVWRSSLEYSATMWGSGLVACSCNDASNPLTDGAILRRNVVYNNFGEGIATWQARGTLIEDNISYDNYAVNLYVADATDVVVQRNLVYATPNSVTLFGRPARGIGMSNEVGNNLLNNITIVNNLVYGTSAPFVYFPNTGPNQLSNALIAHNTLANGTPGHAGNGTTAVISAGSFSNVRFQNNLMLQDDGAPIASMATSAGLLLGNNLWSKEPPASAKSSSDVVGNPQLARIGTYSVGDWFRLQAGSPARNRGAPVGVTADYFGAARDAQPDIGAHEFDGSGTPPPDPVPSPVNLAANRPAVASSTESAALAAGAAFDGNPATRWSSQFADAQWIYVDLGATHTVTGTKLVWEVASSKGFLIQVSADATNWTTIYSTTSGPGGTQAINGLTGVGRYVRLFGQSRNTPYGHSLWEMEVYGSRVEQSANLALNKPVTASSVENAALPAVAAVDGSLLTRWSSQFSDPQWLKIDLGGRYRLDRLRLDWEAASSRSYFVFVSDDALVWNYAHYQATGLGGVEDIPLTAAIGRYLMLVFLDRNTAWGHSLLEAELYGQAVD